MMRKISVALAVALATALVARNQVASAGDVKLGTLKGKIIFKGNKPEKNFKDTTEKDPSSCGKDREVEKLVVAEDGGVKDVVVYAKEGKGDFDPKFMKVDLDQKKCMFHGHVTFVAAGGEVVFKNSDEVAHNAKFSSSDNGTFNEQIGPGKEIPKKFPKPEIINLECSAHTWMSGLIVVMAHPYYTASNEKGEYELKLPVGKQKIMVYQQILGKLEKKGTDVDVKEGDNKQDFEFK
jgi:plastocyanin